MSLIYVMFIGFDIYDCPIFDGDISGWNVSIVTNMSGMFMRHPLMGISLDGCQQSH
jgi:hypothetical protein